MKKSTVMFWAIFGALLMGCSDEEIANVETSSRNAIGFNVLSKCGGNEGYPYYQHQLEEHRFRRVRFYGGWYCLHGKGRHGIWT